MNNSQPDRLAFPKTGFYERNCEVLAPGSLPAGMQRLALCVEYNGAAFHGFQRQASGVASVQQAIESALSAVADEPVTLVCAGRTDTGVHATQQVIHFDTLAQRPLKAWVMGVNTKLPSGVCIRWAQQVPPQFHARFSATARAYRYLLVNTPYRPGLQHDQLTWEKRSLNVELMQQAAQSLVGVHDFSAYRASQCQAKSPVREVQHFSIVRRGDLIVFEVKANAFLHHMVRNMVGVLMAIGLEERPPEWVSQLLAGRDRRLAEATARPNGLHLVEVEYPSQFCLPVSNPGPCFLAEAVGDLR